MRISSPWRKPDTGIYYLNRAVPVRLQAEIGRRFFRRSLGTRDLAEAERVILDAYLESQREFDAAEQRLAARAAADEISAERAAAIVARHLAATVKADPKVARWPTLPLTFWLEVTAQAEFGTQPGLYPRNGLVDGEEHAELAGARLCGDGWLEVIREQPRSHWIGAAEMALGPLYEATEPRVARVTANDHALMDAWNARLVEENARLHHAVQAPYRIAPVSRLRPDLRFGELLSSWRDKRNPRPQSFAETERAVVDLIDFVGNIPVERLTSDALMDYRDLAERLPASMSREDRSLAFRSRVEKLLGSSGSRVSGVTVKKRIGAIQALLGFAFQERWTTQNVGSGIRVEGASRISRTRRSFRSDELARLFAADLFLRPDLLLVRRTAVSDVTLYWLFVLGATSGGRIEEVGQARISDVKIDSGIIYIDIDDVSDPSTTPFEYAKSLKNESSRRIVPVHDLALSLGFAFYVECLRRQGQTMLFPDLAPNRFGKVTQEASRRANRLINRTVGDDPRLVFHSLRHRFKDVGREAGVQERVLDQLCGHAPSSVGARYGEGASLVPLKAALDQLRFDMIDWAAMQRSNRLIDWQKATAEVVRRVTERGSDRIVQAA